VRFGFTLREVAGLVLVTVEPNADPASVGVLACDFLTVETAFLQRIHALFFISLATRPD
jgi:hypothetical protein